MNDQGKGFARPIMGTLVMVGGSTGAAATGIGCEIIGMQGSVVTGRIALGRQTAVPHDEGRLEGYATGSTRGINGPWHLPMGTEQSTVHVLEGMV